MKIDLLDPVVSAAPGETATCRVRVLNDTAGPSAYRLRVVGLDDHEFEYPLGYDALPSGMQASFDVDIEVPREFAVGRHSLAVEVVSDRRGEQSVLAGMTVEVNSIQHVAMRINPSTIRGRRKARFAVELDNREPRPVELKLGAQGQDLEVAFRRRKVRLNPGDIVVVPGTVRGPRRVAGGPANHVLTVVAEGKSAPIYADAAYQQKPFVPGKLRGGMAMLALLGLFAAILVGGVYWYTHRDANKVQSQSLTTAVQDANGDGIPDNPLGTGAAPGTDDAAGGAAGAAGGAAAGGAAAAAGTEQAKPTSTIIGGTVKAAKTGDNSGVTVSLTPALLGGVAPTDAQAASLSRGGNVGADRDPDAKVWPDRYGRATTNGVSTERQTESVVTQQTDGKGAWAFPDVLIPDNYMLTFTKPGFDTKSFIVTPTEDGKAVELDVVLETATGSASGTINGPDGPIGGVDIVISDGDLTFSTKSSSEAGKVGTWSVTGLSTPNTYTLTATVRGFGTQVVQLPFTPGQQRNGVGIAMVAGAGSISGHITDGTTPLGGATITVSSGDVTLSTTSLTNGDAGSYLLPQLKIPGTYTVAVTVDGFMTQTRQLDLTGNSAGIDFNLVHTTASIVGMVASDAGGTGLGGVAITIRHADLVFTSSTAVAPSAGTFRINDVPPGEYLVSFVRYDHADTSQLITVNAGEVFDMKSITMKFQARSVLVQNGRLVVPIFDSGTTAINGATVQILSVADGTLIRTATDTAGTQGSFAFESLPIGTYTVRVTRPGYRTAVRHVTMGLSEKQLEVHLLQLGQVSGVIVNALNTAVQLRNYEIKIYRLKSDGTRDGDALERITVLNSQAPDPEGNLLWESKPSSLTEGTYEVEVSQPPPGFRVVPQVVQDGSALMRFVVSPTDEGTLRLKDIKADTFPGLTGTVASPKLASGVITFTPIESANVSLVCGAGTPQNTTVVEAVTAPGTFPFTFSPSMVQNATALTNMCSVTVVATLPPVAPATTPTVDPAYKPVTIALPSPLEPITGSVSNQQVNIALAKIPTSIGGKLYWRDYGDPSVGSRDHPINTVDISTEGTVITDFGGSTGIPPEITTTTPIIGTHSGAGGGGDWALVGQVFGDATYVFNGTPADAAFDTGKMMLTINESTRTVVSLTTSTLAAVDGNPSINVELHPKPGVVAGTTAINTVDPTPAYASVGLAATPPVGVAAPTITHPTANYSFAAAAGTWTVTITKPAHHVFTGYTNASSPATQTVTNRVDPAATVGGFSASLTELARLSIDVVDGANRAIDVLGVKPTVTFTRLANPVAGDPGASPLTAQQPTFDTNGHAVVQDLDVNGATPTTATANYRVSVTMPGYDTQFASVTLVTAAGTLIPTLANPKTDTSSIPVPLRAGDKATLKVVLLPFGGITGSAIGVLPSTLGGGTEFLLPTTLAPALGTVAVARVYLPDGFTAAPSGPSVVQPTVDYVDNHTFSFSGEPGFYSITVAHPDFAAPSVLATDPSAGAIAGLYQMKSGIPNALTGQFSLPLATGFVQVNAQDSGGAALQGATVYVNTLHDTTGLGTVGSGTTDVNGGYNLGGLPAGGTYTIVMRGGAGPARFPVIADVTIPRGNSTANRTTTLTAKLVDLDGTVTGSVVAWNSLDNAIKLPAAPLAVTRAYDGNGAGITNQQHQTDIATVADPSVDGSFTFTNVPRGLNQITFADLSAAGYTAPVARTASIVGTTSVGLGANKYRATDVPVIITLSTAVGAADVTDALLTLASPDGNPAHTYTAGGPLHTGTSYSFAAIPPEDSAYTLTISHPLYDPTPVTHVTQAITVIAGTATQTFPITLTPVSSQIRGTVTLQATASTTALTTGTTVKLLQAGVLVSTTVVTPNTVNMDASGEFVFTLNATAVYPDNYSVLIEHGHYTPVQIDGVHLDDLGTAIAISPVTLNQQARVVYTVSPSSIPFPAPPLTATAVAAGHPTVNGVCVKSVGPTPVITCTVDGLDSGVLYTTTFSALGYNDATKTITPVVGGDTTDSVTLAQPIIDVTVTTDKNANDAKSATVTLLLTGDDPLFPRTPAHVGTTTSYLFANLPVGVSGNLTVSKTGYRTQVTPVTVSSSGLNMTIDLRQLVTVTGNVLANGAAAGLATVHATPVGGGTSVTVTANAGGAYTIPNLDTGDWVISAFKVAATNGGADVGDTVSVTSTSQSAVIATALTLLPRQIALTGNVTLASDSSVVAGATVVATEISTGATATATSGLTGAYSIAVDVGTWRVSAFGAGKGAAIASATAGPFTDLNPVLYNGTAVGPDLALAPRTVTISGSITDGAGAAVIGADVTATNTSSGASPTSVTLTGLVGSTYSFPNLDVGTWVISAEKAAVGVGHSTGQPVTAIAPPGSPANSIAGGSITGVTVVLTPRTVSTGGSVASGTAVPGAIVHATRLSPPQTVTTTANALGDYTLTLPNLGTWTISGYKNGVGAMTLPAPVVVTSTSPDVLTGLDLVLVARTVSVAGTVTKSGPANVAGAVITATSPDNPTVTATSALDGTYAFNSTNGNALNTGTWTLSAIANNVGYKLASTTIVVTDLSPDAITLFDFALVARSVSISGKVTGTSANNAQVIATNTISGATVGPATANSSGNYTINGVNVGSWEVSAYLDNIGAGTNPTDVVVTGTSSNVSSVNMALSPRIVTVTGKITNGGIAISGASVTASRTSPNFTVAAVTTALDGTYSIDLPNVGSWTIGAALNGTGAGTNPAPVIVTSTSPDPMTGVNVTTLTARNVTYNFSGLPNDLTDSTVIMNSVTHTPSGSTTSFTQLETAPRTWTAAHAKYYDTSGTAPIGDPTAGTPVPVTMVAIPTITGTITANGATLTGARVLLCAGPAPSTCTTTAGQNIDNVTGAAGTFSFPPNDALDIGGAYYIKVASVTGYDSTTPTLTLAADGTFATSPIVLTQRTAAYVFTMTPGTDGITVTMGATNGTTSGGTGTVTLTVPETQSPAWTATAPAGYYSASGPGVAGVQGTPTNVPITFTPGINGVVTVAGTPHTPANVLLCLASLADASCVVGNGGVLASTTVDGSGLFSLGAVNGLTASTSYRIKAIDAALSASITMSTNASGQLTSATPVTVPIP